MIISSLAQAKCVVTFSFDECFEKTINLAVPLLDRCQFKGTFYIAAGFVDKGSFEGLRIASWDRLREMARKGHEIGSHTVTHRSLSEGLGTKIRRFSVSFPRAPNKISYLKRTYRFIHPSRKNQPILQGKNLSLLKETLLSKKIIEKNIGDECVSFAYPGGGYDRRAKLLVKCAGYESARTVDIGFNDLKNFDPYSLKIMCWDRFTRSEEANRWIDKAVEGRYWLIELLHLISNEEEKSYLYFTPFKEFEKHLEYIYSKGQACVAPQKEVMREVGGKSLMEPSTEVKN